MTPVIYVLIMVVTLGNPTPVVINAQFDSFATCENARRNIEANLSVKSQGCYKK